MPNIQDRIYEKAAHARIPIMCSFELLPVCNLSCKMCYVRKSMDHVRANGGLKNADWWLSSLNRLSPLLLPLNPSYSAVDERLCALGFRFRV